VRAEDAERVHEASLRILDEIGVRLEHDGIVERVLAAGARPGKGPHDVRLPPAMVRDHLALAPRRVELAGRDGTTTTLEPGSETVFWTTPVLYLWTGTERRPVTSDEVLTWDAIYAAIARAAGVEAKLVHVPSALIAALVPDRGASLLGDKAHGSVFDNAKLRRLVPGFEARVSFAEGIARSIAWFDADPARRVVSPVANDNIERVLAAWGRAWDGLPGGGPR